MRHKVRFYLPGSLFPDETSRDIDIRTTAAALSVAPGNAFAFVFYDLPDETPDLGPEFSVTPRPQNESGRYYIDAEPHTLAEVEAMGDDYRILASNMRGNRWVTIVRCRTGNWQPLEDGDRIVTTMTAGA